MSLLLLAALLITSPQLAQAQCLVYSTTLTLSETYHAQCGTSAFMQSDGNVVTVDTGAYAVGTGVVTMLGGSASLSGGSAIFPEMTGSGIATLYGEAATGFVNAGATGTLNMGSSAQATVTDAVAVVSNTLDSTEYPQPTVYIGGEASVNVYGTNIYAIASGYGAFVSASGNAGASITVDARQNAEVTVVGAGASGTVDYDAIATVSDGAYAFVRISGTATGLGYAPTISASGGYAYMIDATAGQLLGYGFRNTIGGNNQPPNTAVADRNGGLTVQSGNAHATMKLGRLLVQAGASNVYLENPHNEPDDAGATATMEIGATITAQEGATITAAPGTVLVTKTTLPNGDQVIAARAEASGSRRRRSFNGCQEPMIVCPNQRGDGKVCRLPSSTLENCGGCDGFSGIDCTELVADRDDANVACRQGQCIVF